MKTVGLGFYWNDLEVGFRFKTVGRTVTEADIVNFVNCTGMVEVMFTNVEFLKRGSSIKGRVAPAALVYSFAPEQDSWKRLPIKDMTADFFDAFFLYGPSWFDARGVVKQSSL